MEEVIEKGVGGGGGGQGGEGEAQRIMGYWRAGGKGGEKKKKAENSCYF